MHTTQRRIAWHIPTRHQGGKGPGERGVMMPVSTPIEVGTCLGTCSSSFDFRQVAKVSLSLPHRRQSLIFLYSHTLDPLASNLSMYRE